MAKKEQEINKLLDTLYQVNNGEKIIYWLDMLKTYNSTDGKIPGLFNSSKIQIVTAKNPTKCASTAQPMCCFSLRFQ